jgi:hypothetical protein
MNVPKAQQQKDDYYIFPSGREQITYVESNSVKPAFPPPKDSTENGSSTDVRRLTQSIDAIQLPKDASHYMACRRSSTCPIDGLALAPRGD